MSVFTMPQGESAYGQIAKSIGQGLGSGVQQGISTRLNDMLQKKQRVAQGKALADALGKPELSNAFSELGPDLSKLLIENVGLENLSEGLSAIQGIGKKTPGTPANGSITGDVKYPSQFQGIESLETPEATYQEKINQPTSEIGDDAEFQDLLKRTPPKQRAQLLNARQKERQLQQSDKKLAYSDTKKFREDMRNSSEGIQKRAFSLNNIEKILDDLDKKGKKSGALSWDAIMHKLGLGGASSPEAQALQSQLLNLITGRKEDFGVRLTDRDVGIIMDKLPDISKSKEGNRLILKLLKDELNYDKLHQKAYKEAIKGGVSLDLPEKTEEIFEGFLNDNSELKKSFSSTIEKMANLAGIQSEESGEFVNVRAPNGVIRKIPSDRLNEALNAGGSLVE